MTTICLIAGILSPFFIEVAPEVRSTYVSLGKIAEDRPMQVTSIRAGWDSELFGRIGIRNWDVSSLTDRRSDEHRHLLYHTEFGPTWQYDWAIIENLTLKNDLTRSWTIYDGFEKSSANKTYHWWQLEQSLENPLLVPFWRFRYCFRGNDYCYFKVGFRRKFPIMQSFYLTPSVFVEAGNANNQRRIFGDNAVGSNWGAGGASSVSFRLEGGWKFTDWGTLFAYVEQYEIVGDDARDTIAVSATEYAHKDWTHCGMGIRLAF